MNKKAIINLIREELRNAFERYEEEYPLEDYIPSPAPYLVFGEWKPNRIVKIRLGKKQEVKVKTDKIGRWIFDLNNFENGYKGYKYFYVNNKRFKIDNKGKQEVILDVQKNKD